MPLHDVSCEPRSTQQLAATAGQTLRLADSMISIEEKRSEADAIAAVLDELCSAGWIHAMVALFDARTNKIKGFDSSWNEGKLLVEITDRDADGGDVLAHVLRNNRPEFIPDSRRDPRCDQDAIELAGIVSQYIVPLVFGDEKIGTLQVGLGNEPSISDDDEKVLQAFGKHLAIAMSRLRIIARLVQASEQIMTSSRFVVAQEMSSFAVHSVKHRLNDLIDRTTANLSKQEKRQNTLVRQEFQHLLRELTQEKTAIDEVLRLVKSSGTQVEQFTDVHSGIQTAINIWYGFLSARNVRLQLKLHAKSYKTSYITSRGLGEVIAVLLVNSAQAHARNIEIRTFNDDDVALPNDIIPSAICIDVIDDGIGLGSFDTADIFSPTFTTKSENEGTGLGLFIARQLARTAGGDVMVAVPHTKAKGATFRVIVPLDL